MRTIFRKKRGLFSILTQAPPPIQIHPPHHSQELVFKYIKKLINSIDFRKNKNHQKEELTSSVF